MAEVVDFGEIIRRMSGVGLTVYKISVILSSELGERIGYVQVQRWMEGSEPKHHHGEALIKLYAAANGNLITNRTVSTTQRAASGIE